MQICLNDLAILAFRFEHQDSLPRETYVRKSHIAYLNSQDAFYIFVGQLYLMSIGFNLNSNMILEFVGHLDSCLFSRLICSGRNLFGRTEGNLACINNIKY